MRRFRHSWCITACFFVLVSAVCARADSDIEDVVDVYESGGSVIAVIEGRNPVSRNLRLNEAVLWQDAGGYLGAFLTDRHFLVISSTAAAWQALPLRRDEADTADAFLSQRIALLVTAQRAVGYDAAAGRFIEIRFPLREELVSAEAENHVAVVVTSGRAYGLAAGIPSFTEIRFRGRETLESVNVTSRKATIRTSDRLLTFDALGGHWRELRL